MILDIQLMDCFVVVQVADFYLANGDSEMIF